MVKLHHQAVNIDVPGMINDGNLAGRIQMIQAQSPEAAPEIRKKILHKLCSQGMADAYIETWGEVCMNMMV